MKNKVVFGFLLTALFAFPFFTLHAQPREVFTQTLEIGSTGGEVRALQAVLRQIPGVYPEGLVTGYFGMSTKDAVIRFQIKEGIEPGQTVGIVGQITRVKLNGLVAVAAPGLPDAGTLLALTTPPFGHDENPEAGVGVQSGKVIAALTGPVVFLLIISGIFLRNRWYVTKL